MTAMEPQSKSFATPFGLFGAAAGYMVDAAQRSVLFWNVMRERGNAYREHIAKTAPHVLEYDVEVILDARSFARPVNYVLVRVNPPQGVEIDQTRRPFVVVDPRAGHGPGIGGFKSDSEIGVALKAGHACYFVGFLPDPMPGQTIEDIAKAEAIFLEKVIALHPGADGKPCVIGNCQAGWAVMMLAAIRPELLGPIIVAGSPLSYWAGVRGRNPMRYTGGMSGGSWLTALFSDLGAGKFDGAGLVQNFENLNPSNTLWTKQYNLYAKIDTEAERYLGFERWWGGHVNLNAEEIQFIVDELFVGNHLAAGTIRTSDGTTIDLRTIRSPIVVFCSKGDNITPPQQALGWILDLFEDVNEIRSFGQTIVYCIHETVGHLGIFVSGGIARKEHGEFSSNIDLIDTLPPGLYEAVLESKSAATASPDLVTGDWVMRCEARTLDDIRALGGNDPEDELRFATVAKVSEANLAIYRAFAQPVIRSLVNPPTAKWMQELHPLRLQYSMFSDANPFMASVKVMAGWARENRNSVDNENPFAAAQEQISRQVISSLDAYRDWRDTMIEHTFLWVYGSPALQAAAGINPSATSSRRKAPESLFHRELLRARTAELRARIPVGGLREAVVRSILYIGMGRGSVDERGFELVRRIRAAQLDMPTLPLAEFKALVREQFLMLLIDSEAALAAIPSMLPAEGEERVKAFEVIKSVLAATRGEFSAEETERRAWIAGLFGIGHGPATSRRRTVLPGGEKDTHAKAS
jgi:hypothetical protein